MPKYLSRKAGRMYWVFLVVLVAGFFYCLISKPVGTAIFVLLFCGIFLVARKEMKRDEDHLRRLAGQREGESICEFARDFERRQIDTWIVRAVYEQLQQRLKHVHPAFPVRATDRLKEDLHLDDDDLDMEIAEEVEQRTGRSLEASNVNPYFGKVGTVGDLVLFFQAQPIKAASAALV
jgi:hypothetical protein